MSETAGLERWLGPDAQTEECIIATISAPILERLSWRWWWIAFSVASAFTVLFLLSAGWVSANGVGVWGYTSIVVWGFPLANYVWWVGIAYAGTLISTLLLLTRQRWRASLNRSAETMTLFTAAISGLMPIFHLGRPYFFYWLVPYPNRMGLWPQWRSALVWDMWALSTYILFTILFWYTGLIPDLAILRDRAKSRTVRRIYGVFALGWRGSARHWEIYERYYRAMAGMGIPLVISVHSVVSLDFAASLMPGWSATFYPPYFALGALYSGFGTVLVIAAAMRWGFGYQSLITENHFDVIARLTLANAIAMGLCYSIEWFTAWYSGDRAELGVLAFTFTGAYWPLIWVQIGLNVVIPQLLWWPAIRRSIPALVVIGAGIVIGMWVERILIVWNTLSHAHMVSSWSVFMPTAWDWAFLTGSIGFFAFLFLIFCRVLPAISIHETNLLLYRERHQ